MAEGKQIAIDVVRTTKEVRVVLTLTRDEAQALADILSNVGGSAKTTRRGLADSMLDALTAVGIKWTPYTKTRDYTGSFMFREPATPPANQ